MNKQIEELAQKLAMIGFKQSSDNGIVFYDFTGKKFIYLQDYDWFISDNHPNYKHFSNKLRIIDITNYQKIIDGIKILEEWIK